MDRWEGRRGNRGVLPSILVSLLIVVMLPSVDAQGATSTTIVSPAQEVRTVFTGEFGISRPMGLTYVESLGEFLVISEDGSALRLGPDEDARALVHLGAALNPGSLSYDAATDRVVMLGDAVQAAWPATALKSGQPRMRTMPMPAVDGESATFDPETGAWLILSPSGDALMRVPPGAGSVAESLSLESIPGALLVAVDVGVLVGGVPVVVAVGVLVAVAVGVLVAVDVGVSVGGTWVAVVVGVLVEVAVGVLVAIAVGVLVGGTWVAVAVGVLVEVADGVLVAVDVGV